VACRSKAGIKPGSSSARSRCTGSCCQIRSIADDLKWTHILPGLEVLPNRWRISPNLYSVLSPWLHRGSLRDATVFKTNQINGAWCGVIAKAFFRKPLIVRCGFLWSDAVARQTPSRWRVLLARVLERLVFRAADQVVVAGQVDRDTVASRYSVDAARLAVVANYVDTSLFKPQPELTCERGRIAFVGRLEPEKNIDSLLEALCGMSGVRLTIVGDGSLRGALEAKARSSGVDVEFLGRLPGAEVPMVLRRAEVFVLPSHYEGNPKALVEAMACGVPVIGTRVPGIRDTVTHRETGLLCGTTAEEIRSALIDVFNDASLRARLRDGGLRYVHQRCSLQVVVEQERTLLRSLVGGARHGE
jgi:glycosyltransferase involved in cell wall biosynthesis